MSYLIVLVLLLGVVLVVTQPLRRARDAVRDPDAGRAASELRDRGAARGAQYREIRDAELDHETGKLSDDDWLAIDSTLRSEAVEILRELDRVSGPIGTRRADGV